MLKTILGFISGVALGGVVVFISTNKDANLNTANTISAAWELRRMAESLAPGIDTRCEIAKQASFRINPIMQAAEYIENNPSENLDSDILAIESVLEAVEIFEQHKVFEIEEKCLNQNNL